MDNFNQSEKANRPYAIKVLKQFGQVTEKDFKSRWDFEVNGILVEHKHRSYKMNQFKDWMIDGSKVQYLRSLNKPIWYINTFLDGYAIWDLSKDIGTWKLSKPHRRFTCQDSEIIQTYDLYLTLNESYKQSTINWSDANL